MTLPVLYLPTLPPHDDATVLLDSFLTKAVDFKDWISKVGGLIAFIGAIYLAKAVRSDDEKEGIQAALTMVAGFLIKDAIATMTIFTINGDAAKEFSLLTNFASTWVSRAGMIGLFLGSVQLGWAIKDNNAAAKVNATNGMISGAIVVAIAGSISIFV